MGNRRKLVTNPEIIIMTDRKPVIILTGASRGIGADVARWLGKKGACLTLTARTEKLLRKVAQEAEEMGAQVLPLSVDIADRDVCRYTIRKSVEKFGHVNALVNNAGILEPIDPISEVNPHAWTYNLEVNLFAPLYMIQAAIPELRKTAGRVINISSGAAANAVEGWSAYCSAKAGLTHLTRVLALEEPGITAISVRPGVVDTAMQARIRSEGPDHMSQEKVSFFTKLWKEGQLESSDVPARVIAWLALHAPGELSGEFLNYDDPLIAGPALSFFGENM
jgi:NAD(P)-dependent dehydrogenase (short-subunit alcohol dehydrogenase family)